MSTILAGYFLFSILLPTAILRAVEPSGRIDAPAMQPPPVLSQPATFDVDFRVAITPPAKTKKLQVWLPLPPSNAVQTISNSKIYTFPRNQKSTQHTESKFGNQFAYFEFDNPTGGQLITHQFQVKNHEVNWNLDYTKVKHTGLLTPELDVYHKHDPRILGNADLDRTVAEIESLVAAHDQETGQLQSQTRSLLGAMRWVNKNLTYDHSVSSLSANPVHAFDQRRGHCSDYHGLCSTLARKVGYPSRVAYGLQMFDKSSPSHCKLEVYLPPYGWVPYDLSETQKMVKKIAADQSLTTQQQEQQSSFVRNRTFSGFRENTWVKMTHGVHYELAPAASRPVNVVRTIYAEADGVPLEEPDPADPDKKTFSWMTIHRVDLVGGTAKRFQATDHSRSRFFSDR